MKHLKFFMLATDIGFLIYWIVTLLKIIPIEWAFNDYNNPLMVIWNWSFFPLDMFISFCGFGSLHLYKKKNPKWKSGMR